MPNWRTVGVTLFAMVACFTGCGILAWVMATSGEAASIPAAGPAPERIYSGLAYSYQDGRQFAKTPYFRASVGQRNIDALNDHVANVAILRHWVVTDASRYRYYSFIMPDHDVDMLRQLAQDPHGWAADAAAMDSYAEPPHPDSLMAVELRIVSPEPHPALIIGAIILGILGFISCVFTISQTLTLAQNRRA